MEDARLAGAVCWGRDTTQCHHTRSACAGDLGTCQIDAAHLKFKARIKNSDSHACMLRGSARRHPRPHAIVCVAGRDRGTVTEQTTRCAAMHLEKSLASLYLHDLVDSFMIPVAYASAGARLETAFARTVASNR